MISAEISLYPLTTNYETIVIDFIKLLRDQPGIELMTNQISTQVTGSYADVMQALTVAMEPTMEGEPTCSFVIKVLNVATSPGKEVVL